MIFIGSTLRLLTGLWRLNALFAGVACAILQSPGAACRTECDVVRPMLSVEPLNLLCGRRHPLKCTAILSGTAHLALGQ